MRTFLTQLEWTTNATKFRLESHWRLLLCVGAGAALSTYIWHSVYPSVFWFIVLWAGLATGSAAGIVPGAMWQLQAPSRRATTSGRFILAAGSAWVLMAVIAVLFFGPYLRSQEANRLAFRATSTRQIVAITVSGKSLYLSVVEKAAIDELAAMVAVSELFYPSHEPPSKEFQLSFHYKGGESVDFAAWVPQQHPNDIAVIVEPGDILLRGAHKWLDRNTP